MFLPLKMNLQSAVPACACDLPLRNTQQQVPALIKTLRRHALDQYALFDLSCGQNKTETRNKDGVHERASQIIPPYLQELVRQHGNDRLGRRKWMLQQDPRSPF